MLLVLGKASTENLDQVRSFFFGFLISYTSRIQCSFRSSSTADINLDLLKTSSIPEVYFLTGNLIDICAPYMRSIFLYFFRENLYRIGFQCTYIGLICFVSLTGFSKGHIEFRKYIFILIYRSCFHLHVYVSAISTF